MTSYFAAEAGDPLLAFRSGFESGARSRILFEVGALPPAFFDLRTGIAGELAQKLVSYWLRMAAVVPDEAQPLRFQEFAREANRGQVFCFLP